MNIMEIMTRHACMLLTLLSIVDAVLVRRLLSLELSEFIVSLCCRYRACNVVILSRVAAVEFLIFSIATDGGFLIESKIFCLGSAFALCAIGDCGLSTLFVPGTEWNEIVSKLNFIFMILCETHMVCQVMDGYGYFQTSANYPISPSGLR